MAAQLSSSEKPDLPTTSKPAKSKEATKPDTHNVEKAAGPTSTSQASATKRRVKHSPCIDCGGLICDNSTFASRRTSQMTSLLNGLHALLFLMIFIWLRLTRPANGFCHDQPSIERYERYIWRFMAFVAATSILRIVGSIVLLSYASCGAPIMLLGGTGTFFAACLLVASLGVWVVWVVTSSVADSMSKAYLVAEGANNVTSNGRGQIGVAMHGTVIFTR